MRTASSIASVLLLGALLLSSCAQEEWEYVSIGGDFTYAMRWNETYAAYIEEDLGVDVTLTDVSFHSRKMLADMLEQLQTDLEFRALVESAEVVTVSMPTEAYFGGAMSRYQSGMCGGGDGQQCFRDAQDRAENEYRLYLEELTRLANPSDTVIRSFVWGSVDAWAMTIWGMEIPEEEMQVFIHHADVLMESVRAISEEFGIPVLDIAPIFQAEGLDQPPDDRYVGRIGVTDEGVRVIADLLRAAGYAPLKP